MDSRSKSANKKDVLPGLVIAAYGRHFLVRVDSLGNLNCVTRGRKTDVVCGDRVLVSRISGDQGAIDSIHARSTLFKRADAYRSKAMAANVTQIAIVAAPRPSWSDELIQRCLLAAENQHLPVLIIANKADLPDHAAMLTKFAIYENLGCTLIPVCAQTGCQMLEPHLRGKITLLVGQSGMGKSTIINSLFPEADVSIQAFSAALDSGRHTTTHSRLYALDDESAIIDSPGLQEFALSHLSQSDIEAAMPDFRPFLGQCRFRDCRHLHEPGCSLQQAVESGLLAQERLDFFHRLLKENAAASAI